METMTNKNIDKRKRKLDEEDVVIVLTKDGDMVCTNCIEPGDKIELEYTVNDVCIDEDLFCPRCNKVMVKYQ